MPNLDGRSGPKYRIIADALFEDIRSGVLKTGDKLPTHRDLAYRLGVTVGTITRAYQELERRGCTGGRVGSGTYVLDPHQPRPVFNTASTSLLDMCGEQIDLTDPYKAWRNADARDVIQGAHLGQSSEINLGMNRPPPGPESAAMARTLAEISQADGLETLTCYNPSPGMLHHREAMAEFLGLVGLKAQGTDILLTHGAQHAMASSAMALIKAGDVLLTEELTYPGFASIVTSLGARIRPVAMDENGILPDAFEAAIKASGARVAYLVPVLQNPTTATMSQERLAAIAAIVKRHDMMVIEDDVYGFQPENRNLPLAELAPDNTIYINGFAKSFAPGLRVGAMRPPKALFNTIAQAVQITGWMIAPLMGEIATRWIRSGEAEAILNWHREEMKARNVIAGEILKGFSLHAKPESLHLWMDLANDHTAGDVIHALGERGVVLVGPENFTAGQTAAPNALRLCLGSPRTREDLTTALTHVRNVLNAQPSALPATQHNSMVM
jgi:DNA-binding transcriptional MocR family regulator